MALQKIPNTSLYPKGTSFGARTSFVTAADPTVRRIPLDSESCKLAYLRAASLGLFA